MLIRCVCQVCSPVLAAQYKVKISETPFQLAQSMQMPKWSCPATQLHWPVRCWSWFNYLWPDHHDESTWIMNQYNDHSIMNSSSIYVSSTLSEMSEKNDWNHKSIQLNSKNNQRAGNPSHYSEKLVWRQGEQRSEQVSKIKIGWLSSKGKEHFLDFGRARYASLSSAKSVENLQNEPYYVDLVDDVKSCHLDGPTQTYVRALTETPLPHQNVPAY